MQHRPTCCYILHSVRVSILFDLELLAARQLPQHDPKSEDIPIEPELREHLDVCNPTSIDKSLCNCLSSSYPFRDGLEQVGSHFLYSLSINPPVFPKEGGSTISHNMVDCHLEQCLGIMRNLNLESSPRPRKIHFLSPQPSNP